MFHRVLLYIFHTLAYKVKNIAVRLHNNVINMQNNQPDIAVTLKQIQLRLSVHVGRQLTHGDLADIAGVGIRSIGEWMRGSSTPSGIPALLRLLSSLPQEDVSTVLLPWGALQRTNSDLPLQVNNEHQEFKDGSISVSSRKISQHTTNTKLG